MLHVWIFFDYVFVDTLTCQVHPSQIATKKTIAKKIPLQPCDVLLVAQDLSVQALQHLMLCVNCHQPLAWNREALENPKNCQQISVEIGWMPRQQQIPINLPCGCCSVVLPSASFSHRALTWWNSEVRSDRCSCQGGSKPASRCFPTENLARIPILLKFILPNYLRLDYINTDYRP